MVMQKWITRAMHAVVLTWHTSWIDNSVRQLIVYQIQRACQHTSIPNTQGCLKVTYKVCGSYVNHPHCHWLQLQNWYLRQYCPQVLRCVLCQNKQRCIGFSRTPLCSCRPLQLRPCTNGATSCLADRQVQYTDT
jgi:hypothetical protein